MADPVGETAEATTSWRHWLTAGLRSGARAALDTIYPPQCVCCGGIAADPAALCGVCWREMPFISRPFCERMGTPFQVDLGGTLLSPLAIADPPVFEKARAVARHEGPAQRLAVALKFGGRPELAVAMGRLMATAGREIIGETEVIVPVPLHWTRLFRRRFNHAAALGQEVAQLTMQPLRPELLRRRKRTRQQVGLSRAERQQNIQGAFHVPAEHKSAVEGRAILLIDDVMTTGATANAAARILLRAGARKVHVLTFSRVVTDGRQPI